MLDLQRLAQQRVVPEVQHPERQIEAGPPVGVDPAQLVRLSGAPLTVARAGPYALMLSSRGTASGCLAEVVMTASSFSRLGLSATHTSDDRIFSGPAGSQTGWTQSEGNRYGRDWLSGVHRSHLQGMWSSMA